MTLVLNATKLTKLEMTGPFTVMNGVNVKLQLLKTATKVVVITEVVDISST